MIPTPLLRVNKTLEEYLKQWAKKPPDKYINLDVELWCLKEKNPHRARSEEHTSELQSLMRISYAVFCLKKKRLITSTISYKNRNKQHTYHTQTHNHDEN